MMVAVFAALLCAFVAGWFAAVRTTGSPVFGIHMPLNASRRPG